jgi:exonuclease SbcD
MFPESFDYLALGHLHVPQRVDGSETMRYSGSPLPMGFGEAAQQKSVCVVGFRGTAAAVRQVPVPVFRKLERLRGDWNGLSERLQKLAAEGSDSWIEVVYEGEEVVGDLRERLDAAVAGTGMEILRIRNNRIIERVLQQAHVEETLDDLDADDVFQRCLDAHEIPEEQRAELLRTYRETLISLNDDDLRSE